MIRYQIYTDTFEFRFGTAKDSIPELSSDDIWDMYTAQSYICPEGERAFATKEEAVNYFGENYSDYGTTWAEKGFSFWVLRGRIAFLSEEEYEDDGEFDQDLGTLCISSESYTRGDAE